MEDMQEQVIEPDQAASEPIVNESPDVETLVAAEVEKVSQQYKKELAGLNRRNSELEKVLDDQKKAAMDEQERILYELEQEKAALTNAKAEFTKAQNKERAVKYAAENDIPISMLDTMSFDSWDAVENNLGIIKSVVDGERKKIIEKFKTESGHSPAPGGGVSPGVIGLSTLRGKSSAEINELIKQGRVDFKR